MKGKKEKSGIRKLFRNKLEEAAITPSSSVRADLMRKLRRKEFMQFNAGRMNIYYAAAFLIAGICIAYLALPGTSSSEKIVNQEISFKSDHSDSVATINVNTPLYKKNDTPVSSSVAVKIGKDKIEHVGSKMNKSSKSSTGDLAVASGINSPSSRNIRVAESAAGSNSLRNTPASGAELISASTLKGCAPLKVRFRNLSVRADSCRWTFGDGGYSSKNDPEWIFDLEGEYRVTLQTFSSDGRSVSSSVSVTVNPKPQAQFEISPDNAILPSDEVRFVNFSSNAVKAVWDFGDATNSESYEPSHRYQKPGNYNIRLIVYSDQGCSDTLTVMNAFSASEYYISFPNAFIPNTQGPTGGYYSAKSDEAAQVFHPSFSGVSEYHLKVFSKLGIPIFESNDINLGWDGYNKGQLCEPGVYIWKVRGNFRNGEPFTKMGDVTLLKN